jgi:glycosyltransferase involved in cell wall biosynthesis
MIRPKEKWSVSVIIPAFNEEEHIESTLKSLQNSEYSKDLLEIIVVDNNSTDRTAAIANKLADSVLTLDHGNVGAVRNLGAEASSSDIFVFLDADCVVDSGWISRGVSILETDSKLTCGGPCKTRKDANWVERLWLLENPKHPRIQPDLLGSCIFVWSEIFISVGGFNEDMTSGEDSDFSQRLRCSGQKVKIFPELSVVHLGNPSTISSFIKRQVWHSENYIKFIGASVRDYTFWITVIFLISIICSLTSFINESYVVSGYAALMTVALASLLSAKRMLLTKYIPKRLVDLAGIILLDYTYLLGRSTGIIKSLNPFK